jgi:hypothetical protein
MRALGTPRRLAALCLTAVIAGCGGGASPASTSTPVAAPRASPTPAVSPDPTDEVSAPPSEGPTPEPVRAWTRLSPGGDSPAAREDHTWTVDEAGDVAYLFGGRAGSTVHGDLWAYDLAADAWQRLAPGGAAPAARFGHEAAWVPGYGLVVFGGQAGSTFFGDLSLFEPATGRWVELPAAGDAPVARYGSCSAVSPDGRFWISHGFTENGTRFDDTRAYDLELQRWADETPSDALPIRRCLHVCWWTADGRLALYGGQTNGDPALGDLWALHPLASGESRTGWDSPGNPLPVDRNMVGAARVGEDALLFGGRDGDGRALSDLVLVRDAELAFEAIAVTGTGPPARWGASVIHDAARARVLIHGGTDGTANAEVWAISGF